MGRLNRSSERFHPSDLTGFPGSLIKPYLSIRADGLARPICAQRRRCHLPHPPHRLPVALPPQGFSAQEHPSRGTSTSGDTTAPSKPSTTYFTARSAQRGSPLARTTASVDSQSVDTTSGGERRGRDNDQNVDGRKRHIVVDSMGLLMAVLVTTASVDDAKAAAELFARLDGRPVSQSSEVYAGKQVPQFHPLRNR